MGITLPVGSTGSMHALKAGFTDFPAEVHKGSERDAVLYSVGANATHGLPRTNEDKRKAVTMLLTDAEWSEWGDNEIARQCKVSGTFVGTIRKSLSSNEPKTTRKFKRGGKTHTQNVADIGKKKKAVKTPPSEASIRDDVESSGAVATPSEPENGSVNEDFLSKATAQVTEPADEMTISGGDEIDTPPALEAPSNSDGASMKSKFFQMLSGKEFEFLFNSEGKLDEHQELLVFRFDKKRAEPNKKHVRALFLKLGGAILATKSISAELNDIGYYDLSKKEQNEIDSELQQPA